MVITSGREDKQIRVLFGSKLRIVLTRYRVPTYYTGDDVLEAPLREDFTCTQIDLPCNYGPPLMNTIGSIMITTNTS